MSISQLYRDYGIHPVDESHRHYRPGWANIPCPFCAGNEGAHLGCHIDSLHFYCWRCGYKPAPKALAGILRVAESEAKRILSKYQGRAISSKDQAHADAKINFKRFRLPPDTGPLRKSHKTYLEQRRFHIETLERVWGVLGIGPASVMDRIDYKHRVLIPIYWDGMLVSFQTRDITGKARLKYITCPKSRERIHHKHILYRANRSSSGKGICVEGVTDAWRIGPEYAFATFGIQYTPQQLRLIAKNYKHVMILYDSESQAQKQAKTLEIELQARRVNAWSRMIDGDPADLSDEEAKQITKELEGEA